MSHVSSAFILLFLSLSFNRNFSKFLVINGLPVKRYPGNVSPKKMEDDFVKYLNKIEVEEVSEDHYEYYAEEGGEESEL